MLARSLSPSMLKHLLKGEGGAAEWRVWPKGRVADKLSSGLKDCRAASTCGVFAHRQQQCHVVHGWTQARDGTGGQMGQSMRQMQTFIDMMAPIIAVPTVTNFACSWTVNL